MAISEGRGTKSRDLALAVLDLDAASLDIVKLTDCLAYQKTISLVCWFDPTHLLLPNTLCDAEVYQLFRLLGDKFPACKIVSTPRQMFNEAVGRDFVRRVCHRDSRPVLHQLPVCNFIFYSCAALASFAELQLDTVFSDGCVSVAYNAHLASMMIDYDTARELELVESLNGRSGGHLFGSLNFTVTGGGSRLLRMSLLQPLTDLEAIRIRQDCVEELRQKPSVLQSLRTELSEFSYFNCITALCRRRSHLPPTVNVARTRINRIIYLHHMLGRLEPLSQTLAQLEHPLFANFRRSIDEPSLPRLRQRLELLVNSDMRYARGRLTMHSQRVGAVRPGVNEALDAARRVYAGQVAAADELARGLGARLGLESAALAHTTERGFHVQCSRLDLAGLLAQRRRVADTDADSQLLDPAGSSFAASSSGVTSDTRRGGAAGQWPPTPPVPTSAAGLAESARLLAPELLALTIGRRGCGFTTRQLAALNTEISASVEAVYKLTLAIFELLFESLPVHAMQLYKCVDAVSSADLLCSLAMASLQRGLTRPVFGDRLAVRCGRHPLRPAGSPGRHAFASPACRLLVARGHRHDRLEYLHQVCLMQVMAQAGSDVPALQAAFRPCDRLVALRLRAGAGEAAAGITFDELNLACDGITSRSLVVLDVGANPALLAAAVRKLAAATQGAFAFIGCQERPEPLLLATPGLGVLELGRPS